MNLNDSNYKIYRISLDEDKNLDIPSWWLRSKPLNSKNSLKINQFLDNLDNRDDSWFITSRLGQASEKEMQSNTCTSIFACCVI